MPPPTRSMPFRASFDCLWCGSAHATSGPDDLEGWAQLCPDCLGRAGDNPFLRFRLRDALAARAAAARAGVQTARSAESPTAAAPDLPAAGSALGPLPDDPERAREMLAYYEARAPEYDDWYLRRGRFAHGPLDDMAWAVDLDAATVWLDGLPIGGRIVELAAGTGWWSPLLASKGELAAYDGASAPLDRARDRLLAHGLRAHLHVRDVWAEPEAPPADALFAGFWLSHVPRARLVAFLDLVRRWLRPGGTFAFIDSRHDPRSSAVDHEVDPASETMVRRLDDGRTFTIWKVYHEPADLETALLAAGFRTATVATTSRFFLLGRATA
ncbi:MAG: class I SAM-dependent methyltransferase [Chloroflexi bacterium]|nr:class I SAM-dependent methyltransferase [Chloroflexota bacterium]